MLVCALHCVPLCYYNMRFYIYGCERRGMVQATVKRRQPLALEAAVRCSKVRFVLRRNKIRLCHTIWLIFDEKTRECLIYKYPSCDDSRYDFVLSLSGNTKSPYFIWFTRNPSCFAQLQMLASLRLRNTLVFGGSKIDYGNFFGLRSNKNGLGPIFRRSSSVK